jgi:hypothetical protein
MTNGYYIFDPEKPYSEAELLFIQSLPEIVAFAEQQKEQDND